MKIHRENKRKKKLGPVAQKILLLLETGVVLGLTNRPDKYFKVLRQATKEWQKINQRSLHNAIKRLYQSKLVDYKENEDGTTSMILSENGKQKLLQCHFDNMVIQRPSKWDGLWRIVIFDIPEELRQGRVALANKLKQLGFYPIQKSVFVFPYECKDEVDFVIEIFEMRPYTRYIIAKEIDVNLHLKQKFNIH